MALSRRKTLAGIAAAPVVFTRHAWAQGKSIQIGIYSAQQGEYIRKELLPKFEAKFGCRVFATEGVTLGQITLLRAQRANPRYSVMFMDDVGVPMARDDDLVEKLPLDRIPNAQNVFPRFFFGGGYAVAFAVSTAVPFYNTQAVKPLESYADLWQPRFRQRLIMTTPRNTQAVFLLIATAAVVTGKPFKEAQYLTDQAWPKLAELKPNMLSIYDITSQLVLVAQGQADVGCVEYSKSVLPYTLQGVPIDMCYPKEGAGAGINTATLVKGGPERDLAIEFINHMLDAQVQKDLAENTLAAPTVKGLDMSPKALKVMAYPETRMDEMKLFSADWDYVNPRRSAWLEKFNQIFVNT